MFVDEKAGRMKALIAKIRTADTAYYRDDDPIMTDREYDKLMDELQRMEAETDSFLDITDLEKLGAFHYGRKTPPL